MKITKFEDIEAWRKARQLMNLLYDATQVTVFDSDRDLRRQLRKAAISAMANIAEGFDGGSDAEFLRLLRMARRSATEIQSHLYACLDRRFIREDLFQKLYAKAEEVRKMIGGFARYLENSTEDSGLRTTSSRRVGPSSRPASPLPLPPPSIPF